MPFKHNSGYYYQPLLPLNGKTTYVAYHDLEFYTKTNPPVKGDFIHTYPYACMTYKSQGICAIVYRTWSYNKSTKQWLDQGFMMPSRDLANAGIDGTATWPYGTSNDTGIRSSISNAALRQMNSKVLDNFPSWDVLTDAVELGETVSLFKDAGRFILGFSKGVARRNPRMILKAFGYKPTPRRVRRMTRKLSSFPSAASHYDVMSSLWMSYRYGVTPLLYSIQDAIKVFNTGKWANNAMSTFHGFSSTSWGWSTVQEHNVITYYKDTYQYNREGLAHAIAYVRYTTGIQARLLGNPCVALLRTAWEEVPFSFVVDWFYDIGTWINSLGFDAITTPDSWVCLSEKARAYEDVFISDIRPLSEDYRIAPVALYGTKISATCDFFQRSKSSLSAVPPKLGWGISNFKRSVDSLILSVSRIRYARNHR